ncbi:MAG: ferredoxin oxidoreductase [Aquificaceae bacterium]|nr:ferredoxin oxidoreductase [Aquificaceae bacterium]MCX8075951.1 ferredoxin oxidoreductase [Aquificaceae bacterium]MDW8095167.1 ferredoxin oxidoreductase [Aquificaceae bacterium]MDW8433651.1 ferredoxin oxidoreductase [Aquificaceae bacterium]
MYYVAEVINEECSKYNCKQCTLFCPEPNTLMYTDEEHHAYVVQERCKGCGLCVYVCVNLLKRNAIHMIMPEVHAEK